LALDGAAVQGAVITDRTRVFETFRLAPEARDDKDVSLATEDFGKLIRSKMFKGAVWRGQYKSAARGKPTDVSLKVVESTDDKLTVELTSSGLLGGKITHQGVLRLGDVYVNGPFALLEKTVGGKPPPPPKSASRVTANTPSPAPAAAAPPPPELVELFDAVTGRDRALYLVMDRDGEVLYGITGTLDRVDPARMEILTLRLTNPKRTAAPATPPPATPPPAN
jgi:hypothetical protein